VKPLGCWHHVGA